MSAQYLYNMINVVQVFYAPAFDDRILEVVAVFGTVQMAASRVINLQHHRIAQVRFQSVKYFQCSFKKEKPRLG